MQYVHKNMMESNLIESNVLYLPPIPISMIPTTTRTAPRTLLYYKFKIHIKTHINK